MPSPLSFALSVVMVIVITTSAVITVHIVMVSMTDLSLCMVI